MTREQMLDYLDHPDQLNEKNLIELKEILDEYPYFQSAHLLYVRNLSNEKNFRFASQLKVSAIHATDRSVLYQLLNPQQKKEQRVDEIIEETELTKSSSDPKPPVIERKRSENQMIESIYRLDGEIDSDKTLAQLVKDINESATKNKNDFLKELTPQDSEENYSSDDDTAESEVNDEFITETLAKIYIKQGLYYKAINAFQRLKLKYPEKSIYFAKQIDEVTNLLNK